MEADGLYLGPEAVDDIEPGVEWKRGLSEAPSVVPPPGLDPRDELLLTANLSRLRFSNLAASFSFQLATWPASASFLADSKLADVSAMTAAFHRMPEAGAVALITVLEGIQLCRSAE